MKIQKGRRMDLTIKEKINKLVIGGYNLQEIAKMFGHQDRQWAQYHWKKEPKYKGKIELSTV